MRTKLIMPSIATAAIIVIIGTAPATAVRAQGPGGGFQPSPQMMATFQKWQKWRDNHKHVSEVSHTINGLTKCEADPSTQLNKGQAQKVLAVINAWHAKPVMTDGQAAGVIKKLTASLNLAQLKVIAATPEFGRRGGGGGGGGFGGGRPGGGGGGFGGGRPGGPGGAGFTMPDPRDYNPLNPSTNPMTFARGRMQGRIDQLVASLKAAK
jgi:hypothetical protein